MVKRIFFVLFFLIFISSCQPKAVEPGGWLKKEFFKKATPTEIVQYKKDKKIYKIEREKWIEELHWSPQGTDWKIIEDENARRKTNYIQKQAEKYHYIENLSPLILKEAEWREIGSKNLSGRMHEALFSEDRKILFGGATNSLWIFENDRWSPLTDSLKITDMVRFFLLDYKKAEKLLIIDQKNIYLTENRGKSWSEIKLPEGITKITDAELIKAETPLIFISGLNSATKLMTLFFSKDLGKSWKNSGNISGTTDLFFLFTQGKIESPLFAIKGRDIYRFNSEEEVLEKSGNISTEGEFSSEFPIRYSYLSGSDIDKTLYAFLRPDFPGVDSFYIYCSKDFGKSWEFRSSLKEWIWGSGRSTAVSPLNSDEVYVGGMEFFKSRDGARSCIKQNIWWEYYEDPENKLHADIPGINIIPSENGTEILLISTDGGLYISRDKSTTVKNLSLDSLNINRYYSLFTHKSNPSIIYAGSQDQGFQRSKSLTNGSEILVTFDQVISGDYGHIDSADNGDTVVSDYPGFILFNYNAVSSDEMYMYDFSDITSEEHGWMPYVAADPKDPFSCFLLADSVWKVTSEKENFKKQAASPVLTPEKGEYLTGLTISAGDSNYWYAVSNRGSFFYSLNGGENWVKSEASAYLSAHYFYGTAIISSSKNPEIVYLGGSGYAGNSSAVMVSKDHGLTFEAISEGLPKTLALGLAFGPEETSIFAATSSGAYMYSVEKNRWFDLALSNTPNQVFWAVEYIPSINTVRYGTHGRGIWDLRLNRQMK